MISLSLAALSCALVLCSQGLLATAQSLPVVDLGYERHRALKYNSTGQYYNFTNIRYAAPPTGNNRFRAPLPPEVDRAEVKDGAQSYVCPQAEPSWIQLAEKWVPNYVLGKPLNVTQAQLSAINDTVTGYGEGMSPNVMQTEDCLFLDVAVPKSVFDNRGKGSGAAVMVWIYGGGYTEGTKSGSGTPAGLLYRSMKTGDGIIYVAMNYRLGVFGWLAGPSVQSDGVANAGLYDQRFALEWVQKNIHLFGGDPNRVTVFGESAGGGSIMHQITAYGGLLGKAPFQQAILQSPGFIPQTSNYQLEGQYIRILELTNTSTLAELRALPSETLMKANYEQVYQSLYSLFTWGPAVDGYFVPALPGKLLLQGNYDKSLKLMLGHNSNEGLLFTNPIIKSQAQYNAYLKLAFPTATQTVLDYLENTFYPAVYDGSYNYTDAISRQALSISESTFTCNTFYLDQAYNDTTYSYLFAVPPGIHGEDIPYTYYNNGPADFGAELFNTTAAVILQDWLTTFAQTGVPSAPGISGVPKFTTYGGEYTVEDLGTNSVIRALDPAANLRCKWWQAGLFA